MGLHNGCHAKVWKIKRDSKFTSVQISCDRKGEGGKGTTDFTGWVRLVGKAHKKADDLLEGDMIRIDSFDVSTNYIKAKNMAYTNYAVFDIERLFVTKGEEEKDGSFLDVSFDVDSLPFN